MKNQSKPQKKKTSYETLQVPGDVDGVCCDGGHEIFGHPKVYYNFGNGKFAVCHYCSRVFIKSS